MLLGKGRTALWGLEPYHFINTTIGSKAKSEVQSIPDMRKQVKKCLELAESSGYSEEDIYRLLSEYIHHSFPSQYMAYAAFDSWTKAVGALVPGQGISYFNAMAVNNNDSLTFNDFLTGLIVGDPKADFRNNLKIYKLRQMLIISRYAGAVTDLNLEQVKHLVDDLLHMGPIEIDGKQAANVEEVIANIDRKLNIGTPFQLTWANFSTAIQENLLPGIDQLFCLKRTFSGCANHGGLLYHLTDESNLTGHELCPSCKRYNYCYSRHEVKIIAHGAMDERKTVVLTGVVVADTLKAHAIVRKKSDERLDPTRPSMQLINMIRGHCEFHTVLRNVLRSNEAGRKKDMWKTYASTVLPIITAVCNEAVAVLKDENRVINVSSPCYVIGGIHGHLKDLMLLERQLWRKGPKLELSNYIFCGDYGDDTGYFFETVLYVLALKVLCPGNVHLIRGNYETRGEQTNFHKKTEAQVGKELSDAIWLQINKVSSD